MAGDCRTYTRHAASLIENSPLIHSRGRTETETDTRAVGITDRVTLKNIENYTVKLPDHRLLKHPSRHIDRNEQMAITYDLNGLDISNLPEFWDRKEFSETHTNWTLFENFVFRMLVLRASDNGDITTDNVKTFILRNAVWERDETSLTIPVSFIRRMIGLSTNIFPAHSDEEFDAMIGRIIRERVEFDIRQELEF